MLARDARASRLVHRHVSCTDCGYGTFCRSRLGPQVPRCLRCHSDAGQSSFCLAVKLLKVLIRCHAICTEVPRPLYFSVVLLLAYIMTPCQSHFIARRIGGGIVIRDVRTCVASCVRSDNCKIILHCLNTCIATHMWCDHFRCCVLRFSFSCLVARRP